MLNTYGLRMHGIRDVASQSKSIHFPFADDGMGEEYLQLNYDVIRGEVWADYVWSVLKRNGINYRSKNIINAGRISGQITMQEIADMIFRAVKRRKK